MRDASKGLAWVCGFPLLTGRFFPAEPPRTSPKVLRLPRVFAMTAPEQSHMIDAVIETITAPQEIMHPLLGAFAQWNGRDEIAVVVHQRGS